MLCTLQSSMYQYIAKFLTDFNEWKINKFLYICLYFVVKCWWMQPQRIQTINLSLKIDLEDLIGATNPNDIDHHFDYLAKTWWTLIGVLMETIQILMTKEQLFEKLLVFLGFFQEDLVTCLLPIWWNGTSWPFFFFLVPFSGHFTFQHFDWMFSYLAAKRNSYWLHSFFSAPFVLFNKGDGWRWVGFTFWGLSSLIDWPTPSIISLPLSYGCTISCNFSLSHTHTHICISIDKKIQTEKSTLIQPSFHWHGYVYCIDLSTNQCQLR